VTDLETRFHRIARAYQRSAGGPIAGRARKRELYGLYKQATCGDVTGPYPTFFKFYERAKYGAWHRFRGVSREEAMRRYVALAKELGYRDPGPSPVPWISNETWRREESWVPDGEERYPFVDDPQLVIVSNAERERAPRIAVPDGANLPPQGTPEELHERLVKESPETLLLRLFAPTWPVCCGRLSCLVGYQEMDEPFQAVLAETYFVGRKDHADPLGDQILPKDTGLYHCLNCGATYLGETAHSR
jgi:diazepam-binding inhibitor (GABA receptor modulator, acyl-CoA-binding protein)